MTKWTLGVVLCDLVLAVVINTSAMVLSSAPISFQTWYPGTASAFFTNALLQLVLPVPAAGQVATRPLEGLRIRPVFSVFVENFIFVTCISFTMAVIQTPAGGSVIAAWLSTYGCLVLIGYVTSLILFAIQNRKQL